MPWEYLNTPEWDGRFLYAAGYLSTRIEGKHLVDLNCGTARLLKYIPQTWATYVGNDIHQCPSEKMSMFMHLPDSVVSQRIDRCDVLMCFGVANGNHASPEWESCTVSDSIRYIVEAHKPSIIVLETPVRYDMECGVLTELLSRMTLQYDLAHQADIVCDASHAYGTRRVAILERR